MLQEVSWQDGWVRQGFSVLLLFEKSSRATWASINTPVGLSGPSPEICRAAGPLAALPWQKEFVLRVFKHACSVTYIPEDVRLTDLHVNQVTYLSVRVMSRWQKISDVCFYILSKLDRMICLYVTGSSTIHWQHATCNASHTSKYWQELELKCDKLENVWEYVYSVIENEHFCCFLWGTNKTILMYIDTK